MNAAHQSSLRHEIDRLEGLIGALSVAASGIAASIDDHDELNATHVDRLFGLLIDELIDNQKCLSQLI